MKLRRMDVLDDLSTINLGDLGVLDIFNICGFTEEDTELSQVCDEIEEENAISEGLCEKLNLNRAENMDSEIGIEFGSFNLDTVDPVADISDPKPRPVKSEPGDNGERFGKPVTDDEISKLIASNENANTKKNTTWALKVFEEWWEKRNGNSVDEIPLLYLMTEEQLNFYLGRFIVETLRKDGIEYPPRSLYLISCGILRHLGNKNIFDKNILDSNDPMFREFRKILDSKMKRGFGRAIKQAEPIMPQGEENITFSIFKNEDLLKIKYVKCKNIYGPKKVQFNVTRNNKNVFKIDSFIQKEVELPVMW
ncbi:uncharacterized protein LOC133201228 [Saccostrea echinata]|uniref:uncharacterized protein LOC133201228 n=1 Tax=Saccostrea echinata TaxID=191078 RepID=UPI002A80FA08|nr:uncharacterized protein LOC133201228 [Saccostrea echinata]